MPSVLCVMPSFFVKLQGMLTSFMCQCVCGLHREGGGCATYFVMLQHSSRGVIFCLIYRSVAKGGVFQHRCFFKLCLAKVLVGHAKSCVCIVHLDDFQVPKMALERVY